MSDIVKLIIEIPKEDIEFIRKTSFVEDEKTMFKQSPSDRQGTMTLFRLMDSIKNGIPLDENKGEWIPIEERPLTDEEKEYYTDHEYPVEFMMMYDCPMPDDGQEVLITTSTGYVTTDTYYIDEGGYFENYCDEGDVKAWQPLPEPYKAESEEK